MRLYKNGNIYRHGYRFKQVGGYRRCRGQEACDGSGQPPRDEEEWAKKRVKIEKEIVSYQHISERDLDDLCDMGFEEEEVMEVMVEMDFTIGRTKNGENEWWK